MISVLQRGVQVKKAAEMGRKEPGGTTWSSRLGTMRIRMGMSGENPVAAKTGVVGEPQAWVRSSQRLFLGLHFRG